jgi:hypothetical protein
MTTFLRMLLTPAFALGIINLMIAPSFTNAFTVPPSFTKNQQQKQHPQQRLHPQKQHQSVKKPFDETLLKMIPAAAANDDDDDDDDDSAQYIVRGSPEDDIPDQVWEDMQTGQPPQWLVIKEVSS